MLYLAALLAVCEAPWVGEYASKAGAAQLGLFWLGLVLATCVPYLAVLTVVDRLLAVRKGYAILSILAVAIWAGAAGLLSDRLLGVLPAGLADGVTAFSFAGMAAIAAGMVALLLHLRPLAIGLRDRGFVGTRLRVGRDEGLLNPRSRVAHAGRAGPVFRIPRSVTWLGFFLLTTLVSVYRNEIVAVGRLAVARLTTMQELPAGANEAIAMRGRDGRFAVDAIADGVSLRMVFDPDASFVTLRADDAARLGVVPRRDNFAMETKTASGFLSVAAITIDKLVVGKITRAHVPAFVAQPGELDHNLLGQSFLQRLASYTIVQNRLILKGN